jgi:Na+/melibiose symporter and related transporters
MSDDLSAGISLNASDPNVKLSMKEKISFSLGDLYSAGAQSLITAVYMVFLVLNGMSPGAAGSIIMIARVWDAIIDPTIGLITDNTRTKWGRRKPFIFIGAFCIIFGFGLLFMPLYALNSAAAKYFLYLLAYLIYCLISSFINIPYLSLATEMTADYQEKNKMNVIRQIFSSVSAGISATVPIILLEQLHNGKMPVNTFSLVMIFVFGIFYAVPLLFTAIVCQERLPIPQIKETFSFNKFIEPLKLKAFRRLVVMYLCIFSCMDLITNNLVWFVDYGLGVRSFSSFILLVALMVMYVAMIPVHGRLMAKNKPKPLLYRFGIPFFMAGIVFLCLFPAGWSDYILIAIALYLGVTMSGSQLLPWFIFPDVVDLGELKFGVRNTGSYSGIMSFIRTTTTAIAIGLSGLVLELSGFVKPTTDYVTGLVTKYDQPDSAIWGLRLVIMIPILLLMTLAFFAARGLKLNAERSGLVQKILVDKSAVLNDEEQKEFEVIKKELF